MCETRFPFARALVGAGVAACLLPAVSATAQVARSDLEIPVTIDRVPRLVVTLSGKVLLDETRPDGPRQPAEPAPRGPGCPVVVSTHTDANFGGGSFIVQAGFAENEMLAASYVLSPSTFPVKFESAEAIFATSNATVPTTTQWSILLFDGPPNSGMLLYEESSLEGILPPIQLGPGTNAVVVQVVIDPSDPEQVFFFNTGGTNTISVAFRVDDHNNGPANPCFASPPTSSNAFPVTDVSGLASPAGNWLYGLNCGIFGCPPNGGWASFHFLSAACRPSGDWVMRMTWSPVNCEPAAGACCLPNGMCEVRPASQCQPGQGVYQGDGTTCEGVNCPPPTGACCFASGFCLVLTEADCIGGGGQWAGAGTACGPNSSCPTGACCLPSGQCEVVTAGECAAAGGVFRGVGVACSGANCPQPSGACCLPNGFCLVLTEADCAGIPGVWRGAGTACDASICEEEEGCPVDWNADEMVNSSDISAFLAGWLDSLQNGTLDADFNQDQTVNSSDISAFLTEWLNAVQNGC